MGLHNEAQKEAQCKAKTSTWCFKIKQDILGVITTVGPLCRRDIAVKLGVDYRSLSPRISELHEEKKIRNSRKRKRFHYTDRDGKPATTSETIWELAPEDFSQGLLF